MQTRAHTSRTANVLCWFLILFLVLFPKGGFKVGSLPFTWGYLLLFLTAAPLLVVRLMALPLRFPRPVFVVAACLIPSQTIFLYCYRVYGVADTGGAISMAINMFLLPFLFIFVYPEYLPRVNGERFLRWFRLAILLTALWGIFLFVWHPLTGHFIEIPFLTVNAGDYGELENTKHIVRGIFPKLISTYNNGNLYGAAILILLPMYELIEPRLWRRLAVLAALLLTLSRSVWIALLFYQLLPVFGQLLKTLPYFPRLYLGKTVQKTMVAVGTISLILFLPMLNHFDLNFLVDSTGGGRSFLFVDFIHSTWLPSRAASAFAEVLYASAGIEWGFVGFFAFVLFMFSPLLALAADKSALLSPARSAALKGIGVYIVTAAFDGGFIYIPIIVFYWFAYMVFLYDFPGMNGMNRAKVAAAKERRTRRNATAPQPIALERGA